MQKTMALSEGEALLLSAMFHVISVLKGGALSLLPSRLEMVDKANATMSAYDLIALDAKLMVHGGALSPEEASKVLDKARERGAQHVFQDRASRDRDPGPAHQVLNMIFGGDKAPTKKGPDLNPEQCGHCNCPSGDDCCYCGGKIP